jgi:hypothetical protein
MIFQTKGVNKVKKKYPRAIDSDWNTQRSTETIIWKFILCLIVQRCINISNSNNEKIDLKPKEYIRYILQGRIHSLFIYLVNLTI